MASVSGILMRNKVPCPSVLVKLTEPFKASTFFLTTSMPTPRPDSPVTCSAVEKPGKKISSRIR